MAQSREQIRDYHRRYRVKNRDKINERYRLWKKRNPEKTKAYARKNYASNPFRARNTALRRKFGINLVEYEAMRKSQKDKCAICQCDKPGGKGDWHVDHDHATGAVRQLLCQNCNIGLGNFQENTAHLAAAIKYLRKHQKAFKLKSQEEAK